MPVDSYVNIRMAKAEEQIRVTGEVKRELERRKREGESFNDVLERLLEDDRDILAGAGFWSEETAETVKESTETKRAKRKQRQRRVENEGC